MASVLVSSAADTSSINLTLIHIQRPLDSGATHSLLTDYYSTELALTHMVPLRVLAEIVSVVSSHM